MRYCINVYTACAISVSAAEVGEKITSQCILYVLLAITFGNVGSFSKIYHTRIENLTLLSFLIFALTCTDTQMAHSYIRINSNSIIKHKNEIYRNHSIWTSLEASVWHRRITSSLSAINEMDSGDCS